MYLKAILISTIIILAVDLYYYRALKKFIEKLKPLFQKLIKISYWIYTLATIIFMFFVASFFTSKQVPPKFARIYMVGIILIILVSKIIGSTFILFHDFKSLFLFTKHKVSKSKKAYSPSRRHFLKRTAIVASAIPFGTLMFGVLKSAFDFKVRKKALKISNLPHSFEGLRIIQISDIHLGSFLSDEPIKKAVDIINQQKPDIVFFTGDLVNEIAEEALPFIDSLKMIEAPMGKFSILGNHDYGDYFYSQDDIEGKKKNYNLMNRIHKELSWKLLRNENFVLEINNDRLAILGVENWGHELRFPKLGDINLAKKGLNPEDIKLLLSHDSSHWDAKILPNHPDIAITFSGHTHGMQFGIEIPGFKWSPSKYLYKQWAGLYQKNNQQLYVNRGLGFIGYPGRVGILPEISVFTLHKG